MASPIVNIINKDTTKEEHTKVYSTYPDTTPKGGYEPFHASTVDPIFCEVPEKSKVLDVGANTGEMVRLLREAKQCDAVGVDLSQTAIDIAKEKGNNVVYGDAESLPFEDKTFDVVIAREVLSHLFDPQKALNEIRRVLKDDGFFIGSTPHANLERIVWEEKRLHRRYYEESSLLNELDAVFDVTHLRVLKGGQFSFGFSNSMLAFEPVEMLFKSGGKKTKPWEYALLNDNKTVRVWMGPTQWNADAYYRMIGYAIKMRQRKKYEIAFDPFSWKTADGCSRWEDMIRMKEDFTVSSSIALDDLEKCMKIANTWIFQITHYDDVLAFFECAKEVYPKKKFVTECDDWMFNIPGYNIASNPYRPGSDAEMIAYGQFKMSDAIIVSTSYLQERLSDLFPDKKIYVMPNSIDFDLWDHCLPEKDNISPKEKDTVRIAYTGAGNHDGDIEIVKPVILQLLDEHPNLEFVSAQDFGCYKDITHPRFKVMKQFRNIIDYPSMLKGWDFDIGIAPLRDNEFNRAKSNLRWLEYSALKVPTVMSKVRPFEECIRDGRDGFLCTNKQEWYDALKALIINRNLRKDIGKIAYKRVKDDFNMDVWSKSYAKILKELQK